MFEIEPGHGEFIIALNRPLASAQNTQPHDEPDRAFIPTWRPTIEATPSPGRSPNSGSDRRRARGRFDTDPHIVGSGDFRDKYARHRQERRQAIHTPDRNFGSPKRGTHH